MFIARSLRRVAFGVVASLAFALLPSAQPAQAQAAIASGSAEQSGAAAVTVEGEAPVQSNFSPGVRSNAAASQGAVLSLYTADEAPVGGYFATYAVTVDAAGFYELDADTSPADVTWASPFSLKINDGAAAPATPTSYGQVTSEIHKHHFGPVYLTAGANSITFVIDQRRTSNATEYTFFIDQLRVSPADLAVTVEGEAPVQSNFSPGVRPNAAASQGAFFSLSTDTAAPTGGYFATYSLSVPVSGTYQLDADTTPAALAWASPYKIRVNQGASWSAQPTSYGDVTAEIKKMHLGIVDLNAGENTITFLVDQRRSTAPTTYTFFIDQIRIAPAQLTLEKITSDAPLNVFEDGASVVLDLGLNGVSSASRDIAYTVTDFWDAAVQSGTAQVGAGSRQAVVDLGALPIGHYRLSAELGGQVAVSEEFSVVAALADRPEVEDSPFAFDVAASWLVPESKLLELAEGIKLAGVTWIRERADWNNSTNPSSGTFDFSSASRAETFLAAAQAQGLKVLDTYHSAPTWTRTGTDVMPTDLIAAYQFAKETANHYGDKVSAWELWNEPNLSGSNTFGTSQETADRYAAFLKASSIGIQDSDTRPLIKNAGFALDRTAYADWMAANGVFDYVDIYGYHLYASVDDTPLPQAWSGVQGHTAVVDEYATADTLRWMSEGGVTVQSVAPATLSTQTQRAQARGFIVNTLLALSQGTDKHFAFVVPPYNESGTYFGLLTRNYTPNAVFTAEAAMTAALGEGAYVGPLTGTLPTGVETAVFNDGDDQVIAIWAEDEKDVSLDLGVAEVRRTDIVGASDALVGDAGTFTLTVGPDVQYLRLDDHRVVTGPSTTRAVTSTTTSVSSSPAERVIVQQIYPETTREDAKASGYLVPTTGATTVQMNVYNLNDVSMSGTAKVTTTGGWVATIADPAVTIAPMSMATVEVSLTAGSGVVLNTTSTIDMTVEFDGTETSVSSAVVRPGDTTYSVAHAASGTGADVVRVSYVNDTGKDRYLLAASASFDGGKRSVTPSIKRVKPGARVTVDVPVPRSIRKSTGWHEYELRLAFLDGNGRSVGGRILITDDSYRAPADGADADVIHLSGGDGRAADLTVTWSEQSLIIRADVTDQLHYQPHTGKNVWQADSVQVAIAPGYPGETASPGAEFGVALTSAGPEAVVWRTMSGSGSGTTTAAAVVTRDDATGHTYYELAIPWDELSPATASARLLSVSVAVNDNNGEMRNVLEWGGGIISGVKDSSQFQPVRLVG